MQLWRLTKTRYAATAFDGEGAARSGARWNSPGTPMAYASLNSALPILEVLVHLRQRKAPAAFSLIRARVPDALVEHVKLSDLPVDWGSTYGSAALPLVGDRWARARRSVALVVPSAIVPDSFNVLINPGHPEFARLKVESVMPFTLDPRLTS